MKVTTFYTWLRVTHLNSNNSPVQEQTCKCKESSHVEKSVPGELRSVRNKKGNTSGYLKRLKVQPKETLVATVAFAAALTVPGDKNNAWFIVFIFTNAVAICLSMYFLPNNDFSILALAMKVRYVELVTLNNMTVFAIDDLSIFSNSHAYISNVSLEKIARLVAFQMDAGKEVSKEFSETLKYCNLPKLSRI
ncbi:hypothetical protein VNO80_06107 [Phaseolus coccineus]|uniref:Uncharacterized protein n=1 Tax=Phaseolus coccineus TaxID=3886 RepID=A0AAN9NGA5_PHACN